MKKNIRNIIIAVVAVVVLVAMLFILMNLPSANGDNASSASSVAAELTINNKSADEISKIDVKNASDSYTVNVNSSTDCSIDELKGIDTQASSFSALTADCAGVAATQIVEEEAADLSIYGLDQPSTEVTVTYKDETSLKLSVGAQAAGNAGYYVTVDGGKKVYLFSSAKVDSFEYTLLKYVSTTITDSEETVVRAAKGDEVASAASGSQELVAQMAKMTLSGTVREEPIEIVPGDVVAGYNMYNIISPKNRAADYTKIAEYLSCVYGLTASEVAAINPTDADLEKYGLKEPFSQIAVDYDVGSVTLKASQPDAEGSVYIMNAAKPKIVFKIGQDSLKWLKAVYGDLATKLVTTPNIKDVASLSITTPDKSYQFNITCVADETSSSSNSNAFTVNATFDGKALDEDKFKDFYQNVISASNKGTVDWEPTGTPILTVKFTFADSSKSPEVMEFYDSGDGRRAYISLNGACDSYCYMTYIDKIIADSEKMSKDEQVEPAI